MGRRSPEARKKRQLRKLDLRMQKMVETVYERTGKAVTTISEARSLVGLAPRPVTSHGSAMSQIQSILNRCKGGRELVAHRPNEHGDKNIIVEPYDRAKKFYASTQWRMIRYDVLLRDKATCQCCGATRSDGVKLHADHIVPLRVDWSKRLDMENLQVLCEVCNHGKLNTTKDWRAA